jgi:hypothetical protein
MLGGGLGKAIDVGAWTRQTNKQSVPRASDCIHHTPIGGAALQGN